MTWHENHPWKRKFLSCRIGQPFHTAVSVVNINKKAAKTRRTTHSGENKHKKPLGWSKVNGCIPNVSKEVSADINQKIAF